MPPRRVPFIYSSLNIRKTVVSTVVQFHVNLLTYPSDVLAICALEGRTCATPPRVLYQVLIPHDTVTFNVFEVSGASSFLCKPYN